ncbi:UDP-N-acetylmuramoyl-L-alanyl-D-glutamate--2,6-diaminopimelate ligase [Bacillus sp. PS06]|uniref:UDP-N-acetylmuramoyl-L-alanyl-D-glutamate--2, 6-diaminopimelate ligase n=1 Tax=Bacillus sp. PS06 TaxID=2764176 RepID=UPI001784853B|nr:UDP-N-acetylmuramoyl-L-alanyl-D-glutamate--2,6-diaminopimelate ligase [Bacillus sp. PS06]MBD8068198.1 UDP-N-acetylmuramoyl-L-alanyl-D-glutamate--2,6-diaminopimelate ligase [Bacillus sp. PS06]
MLLEDSLSKELITIKSILKKGISGVHFDSREINEGNLFIAISGTAMDGHQFIKQAIENGAAAIIGEKELTDLNVPYYKTSNSRLALAKVASEFYNHPWKRPIMIGITGTNGKTTTSYLLRHILETQGISCSLIGTVKHIINGKDFYSTQTTPDPILLQKLLVESTDEVIIMEVSSHGLDQNRVCGLKFDIGIFTNLSHDHLDYHSDLDSYFLVKSKLFTLLKSEGEAIIGTYSSWGKKLQEKLNLPSSRIFSFGTDAQDDYELIEWNQGNHRCIIRDFTEKQSFLQPIPGLHNVWNTLGAYSVARRLKIEAKDIQEALLTFPGVPGRFETYSYAERPTVVVDYAHTPDGLDHTLKTAKSQHHSQLFHIFGFRGNRDHSKRETMLQISVFYSDFVILTLDDLNNEDYESLVKEMKRMASNIGNNIKIIPDRTLAIEYAWKNASEKDLIIITGKGPETYKQEFVYPCNSDKETIDYLQNNIRKTHQN